jgi:hypothetical protein
MFKKLPLFALIALMLTGTVSQAASYLPDPGCYPCITK